MKKENFKNLLKHLKFKEKDHVFSKTFEKANKAILQVNFKSKKITYPEKLKINEKQTCNFSSAENFVVFECVHRLLEKGYLPEHLELEPKWKLGHGASGGRADILIRNQKNKTLLLIECKTAGNEFSKEWNKMQNDGGQLFTYAQQISEVEFLCLYACDFIDGKIKRDQKIILHKDNEKILKDNPKLPSYEKAKDVESRFQVWKETYESEFKEKGIFEDNIQAYKIGKNKYTLEHDTKPVDSQDRDGKYNKFATILRKHNIARKETAFEVLVNLFLCKIVDEEQNPQDLKFYWKGLAYDNYFDFVDRLQELYKTGMEKFLNEKISYISNEQIDKAFWAVKNDKNATKKQIQKYFRELKFFSNSAFSFIDTHNEKLFFKNINVLLEVVQMWQGLRLKTQEKNQFLGDMFEFFLDSSIKQSEGQYFTPLPICKFIIASLPLEHKIQNEPLKMIDYACGSGHFLNEYGHQMKNLLEKENKNPKEYYENITGIEKENRLAKISKVSAFMYGQDKIEILDMDALCENEKIKKEHYDVLVANPPFSVKGFLQTLNNKDKKQFELSEFVNIETDKIELFFLERIRHLMRGDGVVGIIFPSSILSTENKAHTKSREILLQYFKIISIAELGSGAFGKTGTQTVVLFLQRKNEKPEAAEHYKNRVADFFKKDEEQEFYQDEHFIKAYCEHIKIDFEMYKKLFSCEKIEDIKNLLQKEIFKDYQKTFDNLTTTKNLKKKTTFKNKTTQEQEKELNKKFIHYLKNKEQEKLYFYILTFKQKVLIVKAPQDNKERKQFLGYEWSGAKNNEGIKYLKGITVNDMETPLFNPQNLKDESKINTAIKKHFNNEKQNLPQYCEYANLCEILDFQKTNFDKTINLNPQTNTEITSKYEMVSLGETFTFLPKSKRLASEGKETGQYPFFTSSIIQDKFIDIADYVDECLIIGDGGIPNIHLAKNFSTGQHSYVLKLSSEKFLIKYVYEVINNHIYILEAGFKGISIKNISQDYLKKLKIPLPPLAIQKKIIQECEEIDNSKLYEVKIHAKALKEEVLEKYLYPKSKYEMVSLENIYEKEEGEKVVAGLKNYLEIGDVNIHTKNYDISKKQKLTVKGAIKVPENTILISTVRPTRGAITITKSEINVSNAFFKMKLNKYVYHCLNRKNFFEYLGSVASGGQYPTCKKQDILNFKIPLPPLAIQEKIIQECEEIDNSKLYEVKIHAKELKEEVLEKYL